MPAANFRPIDGCVGVKIFASYAYGGVALNTLNFRAAHTSPTEADCEAVANLVQDWVTGSYAALVPNVWEFTRVWAFSRQSPVGNQWDIPMGLPGTRAGTVPAVPMLAPLCMLKTPRQGRSYYGKFFALSPLVGDVESTGYSESYFTELETALGQIKSDAAAASFPLVVASPTKNLMTNVESITHTNRLTVQDRRRPEFGS